MRVPSHVCLALTWPNFVFAFHDDEAPGPRILTRTAKHTGLARLHL